MKKFIIKILILFFFNFSLGIAEVIKDIKISSLRSKIAFVSQDASLFDDTIKNNILNGNHTASQDEVKKAAQRADSNGRKTVQAKDAFVGKTTAKTMLVVKSKVKDVVSGQNISGDFSEALNEMLVWCVQQAAARAEANGRKTIGARDL